MAQPNDTRRATTREASNAPRPQNSPGSKSSKSQTYPHSQHLQGATSFSSNISPKIKMDNDHEDHGNHHNKKSVLTKVKEKARKLKKSLSGRKRREDNESRSPYKTPPGSASAIDNEGKDRSEYFGSPSYEPAITPNTDKQSEKEQPGPNKGSDDNKPENSSEAIENTGNMQPQDKGVSVKEYIMNKFEPGDDERALSQVITQTISPKCEKMKQAVNSLLGNDEPSESISKGSNLELDITPSNTSVESTDMKLSSMNNDNVGSSLHASSNLEPNSGLNSNHLDSNPSSDTTQDPSSTNSHEGTKDGNLSKGS